MRCDAYAPVCSTWAVQMYELVNIYRWQVCQTMHLHLPSTDWHCIALLRRRSVVYSCHFYCVWIRLDWLWTVQICWGAPKSKVVVGAMGVLNERVPDCLVVFPFNRCLFGTRVACSGICHLNLRICDAYYRLAGYVCLWFVPWAFATVMVLNNLMQQCWNTRW